MDNTAEHKTVGILKFKTRELFEGSEWGDGQTWQEHRRDGLLVCIDRAEFEESGNYTAEHYTFTEVTE